MEVVLKIEESVVGKQQIVETRGRESVRSQGLGAVGRETLSGTGRYWVAGWDSLVGCLELLD